MLVLNPYQFFNTDTPGGNTTISSRISSSSDDVDFGVSGTGAGDLGASALYLDAPFDGQSTGLRHIVTLPGSWNPVSATLTLYIRTAVTPSSGGGFQLYAVKNANPPTFSATNPPTGHLANLTTAFVNVQPASFPQGDYVINVLPLMTELKTVLGTASISSIMFILRSYETATTVRAESFDSSSTQAALLTLTYSS